MMRQPAQRLPESIIKGRDLINQLASEGSISLQNKNPNWSQNNLICFPFDAQIKFSRANSEFEINITVGRTFDTSGIDSLEHLPIPVNYSYSLDPTPIFSVQESFIVGVTSTKVEMFNFLQLAFVKTLMATHTLLVTDSFESDCKKRISAWNFPNLQSSWDYYGIAEEILKK